jgi:hypothetical protein
MSDDELNIQGEIKKIIVPFILKLYKQIQWRPQWKALKPKPKPKVEE